MSTPHYKQVRIQAFQTTEFGKCLIAINRASPTGTKNDGRKTYANTDLDFVQPAADTIVLDQYGLLLSKDVIIEKIKQENGLILLSDLNEIIFHSPFDFSGVSNSVQVTYDLRAELLTLFEWMLYDIDAKYCLRIVRKRNDGTYEHLFCGDFRRKDFRFTNNGITSGAESANELTLKKVSIKCSPLVQRLRDVLCSDINWAIGDMQKSRQLTMYGGLKIRNNDGEKVDSLNMLQLVTEYQTGANPKFNGSFAILAAYVNFGFANGSIPFANGDTVTIDGKVYTFQTTLTNVDGHVHIVGALQTDFAALIHAINLTSGFSGVDYAAATTKHPTVQCNPQQIITGFVQGGSMRIDAQVPGTGGNSIAVSTTCANCSFDKSTLYGGTISDVVTDGELSSFRTHVNAAQSGNGNFPFGVYGISIYNVLNKIITHPDVGYSFLGYDQTPITFVGQSWNAGTEIFDKNTGQARTDITNLFLFFNVLFGLNPNTGYSIVSASNTTPIVVTLNVATNYPTNFTNANKVWIPSCTGNAGAVGVWSINATGANTFELVGSVGTGAGTAGTVIDVINTPVTYAPETPLFDVVRDFCLGLGFVLDCTEDTSGNPQVFLRDRRKAGANAIPASFKDNVVGDAEPTNENEFIPSPALMLSYRGDSDKIFVDHKPLPSETQINLTIPFRTHAYADSNGNVFGRHLIYNHLAKPANELLLQNQFRFIETGSVLLANVPNGYFNGCLLFDYRDNSVSPIADDTFPHQAITDEPVNEGCFAFGITYYKNDTTELSNPQFANGENYLWTLAQFYANVLHIDPSFQVTRTYNKITNASDNISWLALGLTDSFFWGGSVRNWEAQKITIALKEGKTSITFTEQPDYTVLKTFKIIPESAVSGTMGGSSGGSTLGGTSTGGTTPTSGTLSGNVVVTNPTKSTDNIIKNADVVEIDFRDSSPLHSSNKFQSTSSDGTTIYAGLQAQTGFFTKVQDAFEVQPFNTSAGQTGEQRFLELAANGVNYVGFKAPDSLAANNIYTLPTAFPGAPNMIFSTSAGLLKFVDVNALFTGAHGIVLSGTAGSGGYPGTLIDISTNGIALDRLAQIADQTVLGNISGGTGNVVAVAISSIVNLATCVILNPPTDGRNFIQPSTNDAIALTIQAKATSGVKDLINLNNATGTLITKFDSNAELRMGNLAHLPSSRSYIAVSIDADEVGMTIRNYHNTTFNLFEFFNTGGSLIAAFNNLGYLYIGDQTNQPSSVAVANIIQQDATTIAAIIKMAATPSANAFEIRSHTDDVFIFANLSGLAIGTDGAQGALLDIQSDAAGTAGQALTRYSNPGVTVSDTLFQNVVTSVAAVPTLLHKFTTAAGVIYNLFIRIEARQLAGANVGNGGAWTYAVGFQNKGGVLTKIGATATLLAVDNIGIGAINIVVGAVNTTDIEINVTGIAASNINWSLVEFKIG